MSPIAPVVLSLTLPAVLGPSVAPLQEVVLTDVRGARVQVFDALGRRYVDMPAQGEVRFRAGGACGWHEVRVLDASGEVLASTRFRLKAQTSIQHPSGEFTNLLRLCVLSLANREVAVLWRDRIYRLFISWLRDNTHVLKAVRYFEAHVKDGIDLFRESQRDDGMIWDFVTYRNHAEHFWESLYTPLRFFWRTGQDDICFVRMPVENDVEYLFVEALYYAWQATGDDEWMKSNLSAAMRALEYSLNDPLRYSQKFGLLKRAYTIDTWDFLSVYDTIDEIGLCISPETRFGVMFGDNTGYAMSCERLAEMLEHVGRGEEAKKYRQRATDIRQRLIQIAWSGTHFRHHVSEHPEFQRDFGVNEAEQVSLSNAYSLNRNISQEQCQAIIRTYQRLRDSLPAGSPGEWYMIYPPFPRGWERHAPLWEYMNGGVSPIVAGELAHGAFEHGFEQYGVDILRRVLRLAQQTDGRIRFCYRGGGFEQPKRSFQSVAITEVSGMSLTVPPAPGKLAWMNLPEQGNDLHEMPQGEQTFAHIPFVLGSACIGLNSQWGQREVVLPVNATFASLYLLHAGNKPGTGGLCGMLTFVYDDGSEHTEYIHVGTNVSGWVFPQQPSRDSRIAWTGRSSKWARVGVVVTGFNNPHPERRVASIRLQAVPNGSSWAVIGVTTSDAPVWFPPDAISFGGPDEWAAAAVAYALIEGLAGVKDRNTAFREVEIAPRWIAADEPQAEVCVHYPASDGYVAYSYHYLPEKRLIQLTVTGSGERARVRVPLPAGTRATAVRVGEKSVPVVMEQIEDTPYAVFQLDSLLPAVVQIEYSE
ncbi:MAG: hypothetical protein WHX60_13970 [Armatimonadota bacterium]